MAYTVPEAIPKKATAGERLLFETLKKHLPEDYIVYYEPEIRGRRPDIVIIGPDLGLLVLEVKDYTKGTLHQVNRDEWILRNTAGETVTARSPLKQARDYAFLIADQLKKDKNLIKEGTPGYLKFNYGYGVVFTRLKQKDFLHMDLYSVIDPVFVLTREEIDPEDEDFSETILIEKLLNMFTVPTRNRYTLTDEDVQAIRYHLFPEVRISAERKEVVPHQDQLLLSLHNIKTMDLHQEKLAKQIGDRHRLIRGVAGSGKTLVLVSRARMLAKANPNWNILVLCYGSTLSQYLKQAIVQKMAEPEDLFDFADGDAASAHTSNIQVSTFHSWLGKHFRIIDRKLPALLEKVEQGLEELPEYDAILIDEGQDFEPEWLKLVSACLNADTQSLLLVEDRAQTIFKRKNSLAQDTGLNFRGRSKILTINYRNTAQIVQFAWDFYKEYSKLQEKVISTTVDGIEIIPPQFTKRKGPEPLIYKSRSTQAEMAFVAKSIDFLRREKSFALKDIAILYRVQEHQGINIIGEMQQALNDNSLAYNWVTRDDQSKKSFDREEESIKILTIDSAKGLDFRAVFIISIETMPRKVGKTDEVDEREVSRFYIGMTRALEWLFLSYSGESRFTQYLDEVQQQRTERQMDKAVRKV
ncbi:NERD domain-containing protein [Paenibacillus sp. JNUCC31]|uniref:3'-5' exonuclease n=1 Tax=Paenibacillus sp. JNUCC-31 TaxID=2777983 RepID=UPI00177CD9D0|nr:nuclease-related domain-containing DEAD/DEAH box helicase [Paenibacillus sp. JNUCC-31]QOS77072.1 NERD domain-containing protein [Paenibacillus sp. JNUCC-31]